MKFDELRAIGHNIADSLADGNGLLIGAYDLNVFGEACQSPEGFIEVDFLTGTSSGGHPSPALARAIVLYCEALPLLCKKHGASPSAFRHLSARYFIEGFARRFTVMVENQQGRRATDEYMGLPGERIKVLDPLGLIRRTRGLVVCANR
jgi:hypothetical protein